MTITPLTGLVPAPSLGSASAPVTPQIPSTAFSPAQASADVLAIFSTLSAQDGSLKQATDSVSQSLSATQVADQALQKQTDLIAQLQQLAAQASVGTLSDSTRQQLNVQFQQLVSQLNQIAGNTQFTGKNLLDGTFSQSISQSLGSTLSGQVSTDSSNQTGLQIPNLSSDSLFGGTQPDLTSQADAQQAVQVLATAAQTLDNTQQNVSDFTQTLSYVAAGLESALYNQNAAGSTLSEADLSNSSGETLAGLLQGNGSAAGANGNIPSSILDLIG